MSQISVSRHFSCLCLYSAIVPSRYIFRNTIKNFDDKAMLVAFGIGNDYVYNKIQEFIILSFCKNFDVFLKKLIEKGFTGNPCKCFFCTDAICAKCKRQSHHYKSTITTASWTININMSFVYTQNRMPQRYFLAISTLFRALFIAFFVTVFSFSCDEKLRLEGQEYLQKDLILNDKIPDTLWVRSKRHIVATDSYEASKIGARILAKNGNVVDSAIAVSFAISVIRPQSTGLGGGGFLLLHLDGKTRAFDFRERAPNRSTRDMYLNQGEKALDPNASLFGIRAVAVPGMIAGLMEIHKKYGKLNRQEILKDAIHLAENGFRVYPDLAKAISTAYDNMGTAMRAVFAPQGKILKEGEVLIQKDLAKTLRLIAKNGSSAFYEGKIGKALINLMMQKGGLLNHKDLLGYRMIERKTLWSTYRGFKVATMPLPSSGIFILHMLKWLEGFPLEKWYNTKREEYYSVLLEAMSKGYQIRAQYGGDPSFSSPPILQILDPASVKEKRKKSEKKGRRKMESFETTHFSILDNKGNAVSSTQSINYRFGARIMIPKWGIVLNDTMDDFSAQVGKANVYGLLGGTANAIAPQKTPLSSMSPTFLLDKQRVRLVVGAPGGSQIITAVLQALLHEVDLHMHPFASVSRARIHFQFHPPHVFIEPQTLQPKVKAILEKRGYVFQQAPSRSRLFVVKRDDKGLVGASDPRGSGRPAGFSHGGSVANTKK